MLKRLGPIGALVITLLMTGFTIYGVLPTRAKAEPRTFYSAGTWVAPTCSCPVDVGTCVCSFTVP